MQVTESDAQTGSWCQQEVFRGRGQCLVLLLKADDGVLLSITRILGSVVFRPFTSDKVPSIRMQEVLSSCCYWC